MAFESPNKCRINQYFKDKVNRCCSRCSPGFKMVNECTTDKETVCEKCQDGTFMDVLNYFHNCFKCTECNKEKGLMTEKKCTRESDAVCVCMQGWFCKMDYKDPTCSLCQKYRQCPRGKGAQLPAKPDSNIKCDLCPMGTFSNETNSQPCKPHTRCDLPGQSVLQSGNSTSDTTCWSTVTVTTTTTPKNHTSVQTNEVNLTTADLTTTSLRSSTSSKVSSTRNPEENPLLWIVPVSVTSGIVVLLLLIVAVWICHKKGTNKPKVNGVQTVTALKQNIYKHSVSNPNEKEILISEFKTDPSTSSSDNHSQNTVISQDCNHTEPQPTVSQQCVNLCFTATFNCQVNPSCSIPISSCMQPVEDEFPFSEEEELCMSSQEEDGKGVLPSVQESGMTVLKVSDSPPTLLYCQR